MRTRLTSTLFLLLLPSLLSCGRFWVELITADGGRGGTAGEPVVPVPSTGGGAGVPSSPDPAEGGIGNESGDPDAGAGGEAGYAGMETCSDGVQNQDETGVDCGGVWPACPTCSDGVQNQDETGVDCGGTWCPVCPGCTWQPFGTPEMVRVLGPTGSLYSPSLAADLKTLYFATDEVGGQDVFQATRTDRGAVFSGVVAVDSLNTADSDGTPFLSHDGLTFYFASNRSGGSGDRDILFATRPDTASPFAAPTWLGGVNGPDLEQQPTLPPDELFMVFTSDRTGGAGSYDLWTAQRASRSDAFSAPTNLAEINTRAQERGASLSADALTLYFTSDRSGGQGDNDIWFATRADASSAFGAAQNLSVVNTPSYDSTPELSSDGRELFWISNRSGSALIWRAYRDCL